MKRRLVVCQGSSQLITSVAVLSYLSSLSGESFHDELLITDLATPGKESDEFARYLESVAGELWSWNKIYSLDRNCTSNIIGIWAEAGVDGARESYMSMGLEKYDSLLLSRNWQPVNQILMAVFSDSEYICYGDALGIFFPDGYFSVVQGVSRVFSDLKQILKFPTLLRQRMREKFFDISKLPVTRFDRGYFTWPDKLGHSPDMPYETLPLSCIKYVLSSYPCAQSTKNCISLISESKRKSVLLLTSNFQEQGVVSLSREVEAYVEHLRGVVDTEALIVIKPHPREVSLKQMKLRECLVSSGYDSVILTNNFEPAEVFLTGLQSMVRDGEQIDCEICAYSTAVLGPALILGMEVHVGFGSHILKKVFPMNLWQGRGRHELDLLNAVS